MGVRVRQKDGAWWAFINHPDKRKAKRIGSGDAAKEAAKKAAAKIQATLVLGEVGILESSVKPVGVPPFEAIAKERERVSSPNWKRGTQITYGNPLRCRLLPVFGNLPITDVPRDVQRMT